EGLLYTPLGICYIYSVRPHCMFVTLDAQFLTTYVSLYIRLLDPCYVSASVCHLGGILLELEQIIYENFHHQRTLDACHILLHILLNRFAESENISGIGL